MSNRVIGSAFSNALKDVASKVSDTASRVSGTGASTRQDSKVTSNKAAVENAKEPGTLPDPADFKSTLDAANGVQDDSLKNLNGEEQANEDQNNPEPATKTPTFRFQGQTYEMPSHDEGSSGNPLWGSNATAEANKALDEYSTDQQAVEEAGYSPDSYMGAWKQYAKDNYLGTDNILDYSLNSSQDDWWKMINSDLMRPYYEDVLSMSGGDKDTYFDMFTYDIDEVGNDWDKMLKAFGTDADAIIEALRWFVDPRIEKKGTDVQFNLGVNDGDRSIEDYKLEQAGSDGYEYDDEGVADFTDLVTALYFENAMDWFIRNGMAGDQFLQAFTDDEIKKLTPQEAWTATTNAASGSPDNGGNDIYSPEDMNFHEIGDDVADQYTKGSKYSLDTYGTMNTHMLPLLNAASAGKLNYTWRRDHGNHKMYKNEGQGY